MQQSPPRLTLHDAARWLSDLYCLWCWCGKPACRRAQTCRGDVRSCLPALPLLPPKALAFLQAFDEGQRERLPFEEMMERNEDEWQAVEEWRALVMSTRPGRAGATE